MKNYRALVLLVCLYFFVSCTKEKEKPKFEVIGKSQSQVLAKKGKPVKTEEFKLEEGMNEFRIELQNTYPLTEEKNKKIKIRELTWSKGDERLTVWFHNINGTWRAINKYEWHKDMEF